MINITSHSLEAPPHEIPIWALRLEVQGIINRYAEGGALVGGLGSMFSIRKHLNV